MSIALSSSGILLVPSCRMLCKSRLMCIEVRNVDNLEFFYEALVTVLVETRSGGSTIKGILGNIVLSPK